MKLLIVEENAAMRRLVRSLVSGLPLSISECADGARALRACVETQPDWVLLDLNQADVFATARQISEACPAARVMILTDDDNARLREAAHLAGGCQLMVKEDLLALPGMLNPRFEVNGQAGQRMITDFQPVVSRK